MATSLQQRLNDFMLRAKTQAFGGFKVEQMMQLYTELVRLLVEEADRLIADTGLDKRKWVLERFGEVYDQLQSALPIPEWLSPVRTWLVIYVRPFVLRAVAGSLEAEYQRLKESRS